MISRWLNIQWSVGGHLSCGLAGYLISGLLFLFLSSCDNTIKGSYGENSRIPEISIADAKAVEGNNIQFYVSISKATHDEFNLAYSLSQVTAAKGLDYQETTSSVHVPSGVGSVIIVVPTIEDNLVEEDELLKMTIATSSPNVTLSKGSAIGTIQDNDSGSDLTAVSIASNGIPEPVQVNGFFNQVVEITNISSSVANIDGSQLTGTGFTINSTTCGSTLNPSSQCTYTLRFSPTSVGFYDGVLAINYSVNGQGYSRSIALSAEGIEKSTDLSANQMTVPSNVNFGSTSDFGVSLTNSGSAAVDIDQVQASGGNFQVQSHDCGASLAAGASCTVNVRFSSLGSGSYSGNLDINYSSGSSSYSFSSSLSATGADLAVTVSPVYAGHSQWMEYVKNNNGGTNRYDQPDVACAGSETGGYFSCIHGGELRQVTLAGVSSCANLTMSDALGAFQWECLVSGGNATFYSKGLKLDKGLRDLVTVSGWNANSVEAQYNGDPVAASSSTVWWSNSVVPLPNNLGSGVLKLDTVDDDGAGPDVALATGSILVLDSDMNSDGYNIDIDQIAVVVLAGHRLTLQSGGQCDWLTGKITGGTDRCALAMGSTKFNWIEGFYDGNNKYSNDLLLFQSVKFLRVNHVVGVNASETVLDVLSSSNNYFSNVEISNTDTNSGAWINGSSDNRFVNFRLSGTNPHGLHFLNSSNNNIVVQLNSSNSSENGVELDGSSDNTLVGVVSSSNGDAGYHVEYSSPRNTISHTTVANTAQESIWIDDTSPNTTVNQLVSLNSASYPAIEIEGSNSIISQLVAAHGAIGGISLSNSSDNFLTHHILLGSSGGSDCAVSGGSNPGLTGACANQGSSNASFTLGINLANSFGNKVASDATNSSHVLGTASFASIADWLGFDNIFRSWGKNGGTFPASGNRGVCSSGTCAIWDWRLASTDTVLRNRSNSVASANANFIANLSCPGAISGNYTVTDQNGSGSRTFLANATEIVGDFVGNDDGLCESNEECVYSPNFGAYQGEGDYLAGGTCVFQDGTVSGVKMYSYPVNGF